MKLKETPSLTPALSPTPKSDESNIRILQKSNNLEAGHEISSSELAIAFHIAAHSIIENSPILYRLHDNVLANPEEDDLEDDDEAVEVTEKGRFLSHMDRRSLVGVSDERVQLSRVLDEILAS